MGLVAREERIRIARSTLICSHGGLSRRGQPANGSSNPLSSRTLWLCSEPTGWPFPHIARSHGCWCVCPHEYAQPLGFETSPWLIAVGGLPLPLSWRKWRGKKESKRVQRSQRKKEKRTTLRWEEEREWPAGGISASWGSLMGSCISDRSPTFSHSTALSLSSPWRIIKTDDTDAVPSGTTALDCRAICTIIYRPPPNPPPSPCPPL